MVAVTMDVDAALTAAKKKTRRRVHRKPGAITAKAPMAVDRDGEGNDGDEAMVDVAASTSLLSITDVQETGSSDTSPEDDSLMIDQDNDGALSQAGPSFPPLSAQAQSNGAKKSETRRVPIPPHRMSPLKKDWINIFSPLAEILGLQVRMNVQRKSVDIRTSKHTKEIGALQKGADFVKAYALGFDVNDSIALLRLDDLYLDSFEIKDVKSLHGDHLSRAIGRIAGHDGKTKFTIENTSRTRIVLADTKIHILGSFQNIKIAKDAIVSLILGSPPGKVYAGLRTVASRMRQRAL